MFLHVGVTMLQIKNITLGKIERNLRNRHIVTGSGARPSSRRASWTPAPRWGAPSWTTRAGAHWTARALSRVRSCGRGWTPWPLFISAKFPRPFNTSFFAGCSTPCAPPRRSSVRCSSDRLIRALPDRALVTDGWAILLPTTSTWVHAPWITKRIPGSSEIVWGPTSPGLIVVLLLLLPRVNRGWNI